MKKTLSLNAYDLYDIGVVDINNDNNLDIFTVNHSALQSLMLNQDRKGFVEKLEAYGLSQDISLPKTEVSNKKVFLTDPGLYIYRKQNFRWDKNQSDNVLVLHAKNIKSTQTITGYITINSTVRVNHKSNFSVNIRENKTKAEFNESFQKTVVKFKAGPGDGELVLETELTALPAFFQISEDVKLDTIHIGLSKLHPQEHNFTMQWRDRHGTAWADINNDGNLDAFITRGGLKGKLANVVTSKDSNFLTDELFVSASDKEWVDISDGKGIEKKNCPGRQAAWVDFDQDNKLDFYVVCGRGVEPLATSPNQLYRQKNRFQFTDVSTEVGLDFPERGTFLWIDVDGDSKLEFLWATEGTFKVFQNKADYFELYQTISSASGRVKEFSVYDFDTDGDLDIFAVGTKANILLINNEGNFFKKQPSSLGLPDKVASANWVDYDNDGLVDLYTVPQGIFQHLSDHTFEETKLLAQNPHFSKIVGASSTWFDVNNDGYRDLLISLKFRPWWLRILGQIPGFDIPDLRNAKVSLYENRMLSGNNWIQFQLGTDGNNAQAIGAEILLETNQTKQIVNVGHAEGSHFSQGHYRLYIGLGTQNSIESITITWPDGSIQTLAAPPINQIVAIKQQL